MTDEEKKARRKERYANDPEYRAKVIAGNKRWRSANPEKVSESCRNYRKEHREELNEYSRNKYNTNPAVRERKRAYAVKNAERLKTYYHEYDLARRDKKNEYNKVYIETHEDELKVRRKQHYTENKHSILRRQKEHYYTDKSERARCQVNRYDSDDKKRGYDTTKNITREWLVDHVYASACIYCGDSDWTHLGCDRIDNGKPHTPDNVVCSCGICNVERGDKFTVEEFIKYRKTHPRTVEQTDLMLINHETSEIGALKKKQVPGT